jgi:hypothetical protein
MKKLPERSVFGHDPTAGAMVRLSASIAQGMLVEVEADRIVTGD